MKKSRKKTASSQKQWATRMIYYINEKAKNKRENGWRNF